MVELKNPGPIEFEAVIQGNESGTWVDFPLDLKTTFGKGNLVPFKAVFDGRVEYQGSLAKMGGEQALLLIRSDVRAQIGKQRGDKVRVKLTLDDAPRTVNVPADLQAALTKRPDVLAVFEKLAYTHRKEYVRWIEEAKRPETRIDRIAKTVEALIKKKLG